MIHSEHRRTAMVTLAVIQKPNWIFQLHATTAVILTCDALILTLWYIWCCCTDNLGFYCHNNITNHPHLESNNSFLILHCIPNQ